MEGAMPALTTEQVLIEEAKAIHGEDLTGKSGRELYRALNGLDRAALCLSGGGIRSACFSLGVIQALAANPAREGDRRDAEHSLLRKFHYLSTVSGGGYIGSWFSAWVERAGFPAVWAGLVGKRDRPENEAAPIAWLRSYSNFLTPQLGLTSADTWAAIALVLRNLFLNWLVIIPVLCFVLVVLKLFAGGIAVYSRYNPASCETVLYQTGLPAILLLIASLAFATRHRPTRSMSQVTQTQVLIFELLPAVVAGILFTFALSSPCTETFVRNEQSFPWIGLPLLPGLVLAGVVTYVVSWFLALPRWRSAKDFFGDLLAWAVAGAAYGAMIATGIKLFFLLVPPEGFWPFIPNESFLLVFGVPWLLLTQLVAEMLFVGLTSWEDKSDGDREWLARTAGWFLVAIFGWALLMTLVFVGTHLVGSIYGQVKAWLVAGGAGAIVAWLGKSSATQAKGKPNTWTQLIANIALAIAGPVFLGALIIGLSALIDASLFGRQFVQLPTFSASVSATLPDWPGLSQLVAAGILLLIVAYLASKFININRFSLHALYRNRLMRAFLGASNSKRAVDRNLFTDFAESDNRRMHELWPKYEENGEPISGPADWRPMHVVNMALNVVSSKKLAWQERKAQAFTVSPLHAGAPYGGAVEVGAAGTSMARGAYRPSKKYGGGISLATAMAISGAAASSNMGYYSSPSLSILLTLLNVRLGWWLGNPGKEGEDTHAYEGPITAVKPLLAEMFGQTTDDHPYVYLSDGGHFENLGLYEMVRRRCRFIVAVDAACDMKFEFDGLGNAARKIWIDLGVDITFRGLGALRHRPRKNFEYGEYDPPFHALGTIHYRNADDGGEDGVILYIKPAFHRARLQDVSVANYALCHPDFPHETTADQFFSESQFESYRALGFDITDNILRHAASEQSLPTDPKMAEFFKALNGTLRTFPLSEFTPPGKPAVARA
jgi:hypothetical protein